MGMAFSFSRDELFAARPAEGGASHNPLDASLRPKAGASLRHIPAEAEAGAAGFSTDALSGKAFRRMPQPPGEAEIWTRRLAAIAEGGKITRICRGCRLYEFSPRIDRLPPAWDGTTVLHLSDLHFSPRRPGRIRRLGMLAEHLARTTIDFMVVTGDFVTSGHEDLSPAALRALAAVAPGALKMFVLGNHDFWGGSAPIIRRKLDSIGFQDMTDRHIRCRIGEEPLNLYGIDDYHEGRVCIPPIAGPAARETALLFMHSLDALQSGFPDAFDLVLSGHTHGGGEMRLFGFDGMIYMKLIGRLADLNRQKTGWDLLSGRLLSYISPGSARLLINLNAPRPGAALHRLVSGASGQSPI